jgi:protoporphyrin/coproporphyrin ferrochelatase
MKFVAEPPAPSPGNKAPATAILLCNLGTPDAPTASAVRRYLFQFLHDWRVIEIPRLLWCPILHGIILRIRPAKSAAKYATIWTPEGSPLTVWTDKLAKLLAGYLGHQGHQVLVRFAMTYGNPGIPQVMTELKAQGVQKILVIPLYPQYCSATTGSVSDAVFKWCKRIRHLPELRFTSHFHTDPGYIGALVKRVTAHWQQNGRAEKLVMSFHGMPDRTRLLGDPYHSQCEQTAQLLARQLRLEPKHWQLTFQSRLGRAKWLQPYTEPTLIAMAKQGIKTVDLICPGFVADNLETLEEMNQEAREAFMHAGGQEFHFIDCLNDQHEWVNALRNLAARHLQGWGTTESITVST